MLRNLVEHARKLQHRGPLTSALALSWAQVPPPTHSPRRVRRLNAVRHFALFWAAFDPRTQVPAAGLFGPAYRRAPVHIYTSEQIAALLARAQQLPPQETLWPRTLSTLLGLLACTGLRISEALHLQLEDWEPTQAVLTIRQAKFGQSRYVPLAPSAASVLKTYLRARVSEALQLRHQDIHWGAPVTVCLHGKGRKERAIPLLKPIAQELKRALAQLPPEPASLVFENRFGQPLTRWGVEKRLRRTVQQAVQHCPSLKGRRVSPHTFRHTTAMGLLQADVDIMVIALILGHESPTTTHHYIELDIQMKERCLRKLASPKTKTARFQPTDQLLKFLDTL